ncbi:MAG: hypothetical protein K2J37_02890 [Ruminococcus sp.]|nr:hypothetical protein [Ruminococcus sp.]MDE6785156.1 hypothetical protein [Ruminococcus sp.]
MASCSSENTSDDVSDNPSEISSEAEIPADENAENPEDYGDSENPENSGDIIPVEGIEPSVTADSGDAYLAIVDGSWWIQYWGKNDNPEQTMLSYNAGVTKITGNGDYTVSVTADTNGFRFDTTGDINDGSCIPGGLGFMAVIIRDGEKLFPDSVITVNEIRVDGKPVSMSKKAYTSPDNKTDTKASIMNSWLSEPEFKSRSADGALYDSNGSALPVASQYSVRIVDTVDFTTWTTVEVDFTVSGIR